MLKELHISNFTIIEQLELELQTNMTVVTGETGAGKSIVIDALELILGGRADSNMIRHGSDRCDLTALFLIEQIPAVIQWLEENELYQADECLLRRTISRDGRSRSYINGQPMPLQAMRHIGEFLVNIHGQHEHHALLKREAQRQHLDNFASHSELLGQTKAYYEQWLSARKELDDLTRTVKEQTARSELLRYQVQELQDLGLTQVEIDELDKEHKQLANVEQLQQQFQYALTLIMENEEASVTTLLHNASTALSTVKTLTPVANTSVELINNAIIQIQEAASELRYGLNDFESNPARLAQIEQRLQLIHDLARKHRISPEKLPHLEASLTAELKQFDSSDARLEQLEKMIEESAAAYLKVANKLSKSRKEAAKRLDKQMTHWMQELGMKGGEFTVQFEPLIKEQFTAMGIDKLEIMVRTNPGQPLQPLNKVVSGGELSRISLALQMITAKIDDTPTLIFDEVDVGIGGSTAAVVGQLLRTLGKSTQVLCVTHLPQVAAHGHHHIQVEKIRNSKETHTQVMALSAEQRITEIARMLGGLTITEQTKAHAQELLTGAAT